MDGKDLHIGDFDWGILPPAAPLTTATLTMAGMAMAFCARRLAAASRVSFIGEGGSSLGEWHEAINLCAARRLPAIFCVENNQTALSTPVARAVGRARVRRQGGRLRHPGHHHRRHRSRRDRRGVRVGGRARARRARARRSSSSSAMRMCGHAHHDDMLYLGKDPPPSWDYPPLTEQGYANRELYEYWAARDPIADVRRAARSAKASSQPAISTRFKREAEAMVEREARAVIDAPWPEPAQAGVGVFADEPPRVRVEVLDPASA